MFLFKICYIIWSLITWKISFIRYLKCGSLLIWAIHNYWMECTIWNAEAVARATRHTVHVGCSIIMCSTLYHVYSLANADPGGLFYSIHNESILIALVSLPPNNTFLVFNVWTIMHRNTHDKNALVFGCHLNKARSHEVTDHTHTHTHTSTRTHKSGHFGQWQW